MVAINKINKAIKVILKIVVAIIIVLGVCFIVFFANSLERLEPLTDIDGKVIPNAIAERNEIEIGGVRQVFFIRSENPNNPVILFLHAGPGNPELPFIIRRESEERLEKHFTVCYWEQRGAGASYSDSINPTTMTVERIVEDASEMTLYLQKRFKQEKIYLMGHSWGTYLGVKTIEKYPTDYLAYFGIGQVSNQWESELLAYDYMLKHAKEINDEKSIIKLKQFDKDKLVFPDMDYEIVRTELMEKYGIGTMHTNSSINTLVNDVLRFKGYTTSEKMNYPKGSLFSLQHLLPSMMKDNLFSSSTSFQIPVYIIHGKYDYQVSYDLAKKYFNVIEAPQKEFFTFDNSAHSPNMEESERFVQIVKEINTLIQQ